MTREITIIGGGLAGLTLGIVLRRAGVRTTILEAGCYPRHRVCGEFISGQGISVLRRLGLLEFLEKAGARRADTVSLCLEKRLRHHKLSEPALCISRFKLDRLLAEHFVELGGHLKTNKRYQGEWNAEGLVRATGRDLHAADKNWRWYGLKGHARNVSLETDLEMHYGTNGYVGLCRIAEDMVNVCGLFRRKAEEPHLPRAIQEKLRGSPGTLLFDRLEKATWEAESICAVAGLAFGPLRTFVGKPCCVGDVFGMIPPLTGNGMSIAFESAELAAEHLMRYAREEVSWANTELFIARSCEAAFRNRFFWANLLQKASFSPFASLLSGFLGLESIFQFSFKKTRT